MAPRLDGWRLQLALALGAGLLWAAWPEPKLAVLVGAYAAVWLVANLAVAFRPGLLRVGLGTGQRAALVVLCLLPPAGRLVDLYGAFGETELLDEIDHQVAARLRLERTPSIAPPLVASDRPQTFYVHAPDAERVEVSFDSASGEAARMHATALGHGVFRVVYDPRTHGPPAAEGAFDAAIVVDGATTTRAMESVTPLAHPRGLRPSPSRGAVVATSEETDEVVLVTLRGERWRVTVGDGPSAAVFVSERQIAVSHRYGAELRLLDARTGEPAGELEVGPFARDLDALDGRLAIARGGPEPELVVVLEGAVSEGAVLERIPLPAVPDLVRFGPSPDELVVSTRQPPALHRFTRSDGEWRAELPPLHLGRPAVAMARSPRGDRLVVAVTDYRPEGPPHLGNHFIQDQLITVAVARWRVVDQRLTAIRTARQESPGNLDRGVSPMGIDLTEDGAMLVAFAGTDDVWRFPRAEEAERPVEPELFAMEAHPLAAPLSAVASADGGFWVSSGVYGAIARFDARGRHLFDLRLAPDDHTLLRSDEHALQRRIGERTFYESTQAGVSCQSCHLHGDSDGTTHNIGGATFVATLDVRGLMGTPPFLRDGGYPRLGSLDELSRTLYRGYLRHQGGRKRSLERYLVSLPRATPFRQLTERDEAAERRGLDAFYEARCPLCHTPPAFTNLGQHPAEALFPEFAASHAGYALDTPSLLGLEQSAPYLVDGRAQTLRAVFDEHDPAHRHGDTASLSERSMADLLAFLEAL